MSDTKEKGWHHGYLGALLVVIGIYFEIWWLITIGLVIVIDELYQVATKKQYSGPLHWLYVNTLYKLEIVKKINALFDKLFGKK